MRLLVDASEMPLRPATPLFARGGEYECALDGLVRAGALRSRLPDRLFLSLYAYELVERLRGEERTRGRDALVHAPFWPELLFEACDELVHPARELLKLAPASLVVTFVVRDDATLLAAAERVVAGVALDPTLHRRSAERHAAALGWEVVEP